MKGYYNGTMFEGFMSFLGLKRNWNEDADSLRLEYSGDYSLLNLVHTHEATVASSESLRPVIGTVGLGFCVAMAGYDSSQKVGFLSHNCPGDYVEVFHDLIL